VDLLFQCDTVRCYVEVKSVTLVRNGVALFPDAPTARGAKHLADLSDAVREGHRAAVIFVIQRDDARELRPHATADPVFADACRAAKAAGVKLLACGCEVTTDRIALGNPLPVRLRAGTQS